MKRRWPAQRKEPLENKAVELKITVDCSVLTRSRLVRLCNVVSQVLPLSFMKAPTSLCSGYKQVESFGPDEEYEGEEEVCYVTLDMGNVEPTLVPSSSSYRLIVRATL